MAAAALHWPIIEMTSPNDQQNGQLEMIIPYDEGTIDADGYAICGIPDRTLGALLDMLAISHSDNITVVLDCCHSGHGTRGGMSRAPPFKARCLEPKRATPVRENVDRQIWDSERLRDSLLQNPAQSQQRFVRGGFTQRRAKSHVLMAACGQNESAFGGESGGLFTTSWLEALRNEKIRPRSYAQLLKYVNEDLDKLRKEYPGFVIQHPQCEGVTRDRLVFEKTQVDPNAFDVVWESNDRCRINGPCQVMGVTSGTCLELYNMNDHLQINRILGTAVVREVFSDHCFAEVAKGTKVTGEHHTARILNHPYRLRFAVVNHSPGSQIADDINRIIDSGLFKMDSEFYAVLEHVLEPDDADLVLTIDDVNGGRVIMKRRDVHLRDLLCPQLDLRDVRTADFPKILNAIARFNFCLGRVNELHPFVGYVQMEFHLVGEDLDLNRSIDARLTRPRMLSREVLFRNDEAKVIQSNNDDYAFVLRNSSSADLFAHVVYFDPGTYEITVWYSPWEEDKPTLLSEHTLQVGASPEHHQTFQFFLPQGTDSDTSSIKVFLMDAPTKMTFMEQLPQVGRDEHGNSHVGRTSRDATKPSVHTPPQKGGWDSITRRITVTKR
ncbi:unnamed protein product [Somion occarium]